MKKIIYSLLVIFILNIMMISSSCEIANAKESNSEKYPSLLQRNEKIQLGKEWEIVQNQYASRIQSLQKQGDNHEARLELAQLFIKEARVTGEHGHYYPASLEMTDGILKDDDISQDLQFRALMTKAGVLLSLHEFEKAMDTGMKAYNLNPYNAQIHGVLVDAHVEMGSYEEAIKFADQMINIKPDIRSYSRVSYLREINDDLDGAIEAMTYAVKSGYPGLEDTSWAMLTLGDLYKKKGDLEKAKKVYEEILSLRENYPFAVAAIADIHFIQGDYRKAENTLNEAISIIPEVGYYIQLAELYKAENRIEEMNATVEEILLMLKDDTDHGHNMNLEYAHVYLDLLEDPTEALVYAQREYNKRSENRDVNQTIAEIYLAQDNSEAAKSYLAKASLTSKKL